MLQSRMIGSYVQQQATKVGLDIPALSDAIGCEDHETKAFLKGRAYLSFEQMTTLAKLLNVTVSDILKGDRAYYDANVVHCMQDFTDNQKREDILDILDLYLDIKDAVEQ